MAATRSRARSGPLIFSSGPWKGVRDTSDPFDDGGYLADGTNGYFPDLSEPSGYYARPGFTLTHGGTAIHTSGSPFRGQCVYAHTALDGTVYNFGVMGGHLFRVTSVTTLFDTWTDVSPAGITISAATTARVKMLSLANTLIVSDGVNDPWIATNLASSPITGTKIQYDAASHAWSALDMTEFGGSVFFVLNTVNSVYRQFDLVWCEPGQASLGYEQTGYSNFWTVEQNGTDPLTAICGTNVGLYYFRKASIGRIGGSVGPDLSSTATHDSVAANIGTKAPQSIQVYADTIYFSDSLGRPQAIAIGSAPRPIWKMMRARVESAQVSEQATTAHVTVSAFEPVLNHYLVGTYSPYVSNAAPPTDLFAFEASSGQYVGRWSIGGSIPGISIEAMGILTDATGHSVLVVLGSKDAWGGSTLATSGFAWAFNALGDSDIWTDNAAVPAVTAKTGRIGYSAQLMLHADRITAITTAGKDVAITTLTGTVGEESTTPCPVSSTSSDHTFRTILGTEAQGRGIQVTVQPLSIAVGAGYQWSLQRVEITGTQTVAAPDDP